MIKKYFLISGCVLALSACGDATQSKIENYLTKAASKEGYQLKDVENIDGSYYATVKITNNEINTFENMYRMIQSNRSNIENYYAQVDELESAYSKKMNNLCPPTMNANPQGAEFWQGVGEIKYFVISPKLPGQLFTFASTECLRSKG
ncbi:hypothetical protein [Shewanella woodyi]|uniref:hypothetical protein n=1 Tax=Shewanella woodyi TaxID=60961 RepID=UPI0007F88EC6|nr:hypothetical protein [Shewanella woodyi]